MTRQKEKIAVTQKQSKFKRDAFTYCNIHRDDMVAAIECQQSVDVCVCKLFVTMGESRRISVEFYGRTAYFSLCDRSRSNIQIPFEIIEIVMRLNIWNLFVSF